MKKQKSRAGKKYFGYDGTFYTVTGKIFDIIAISLYWLVGCIPLITIGSAFSAMYATVTKVIRADQSSAMLEFWRVYRRDIKAAIPLWLLYAGLLFLLLLNFGIVRSNAAGLVGLFFLVLYAIVILLVLLSACYAFALLSRFDMPVGWQIKMSFYMTVRYLPRSLFLLILFVLCYFIILWQPLFVLLVPALGSWLSSFLIEPALERHMPQEKNDEKEDAE